jgi:hypothetical protein
MLLYQILDSFLESTSHSSLYSIWEQTKTCSYQELIAFFKKEYIEVDAINRAKDNLFKVTGGYLEVDEIVLAKSKKDFNNFIIRRRKSAGGYIVNSVSIVLLIWTNGEIRVPIRLRIRKKGESVAESLLYLIGWYRNKISKKIEYITFDTGFSSAKVLKRINDYGWCFVSKIGKTRKFEGKAVYKAHRGGYFTKIGNINTEFKVKVVRREDKFYITNRIITNSDEIVKRYRSRAIIEEVFRILKQECHWDHCQLRSYEDYERYYIMGCFSFTVLEYMRIKGFGSTIYQIRTLLLLGHVFSPNDEIERILA